MKNPGVKIPYLRIHHDVPTTTRCVEVRIPNADSFMPVLAGLIAQATKWFNYERDDTHKAAQLAAIWKKAYTETDWTQCMNCEELTACLQPILDDLAQRIENNIISRIDSGFSSSYKPGEVLPETERYKDLAPGYNPGCNEDIICGQVNKALDYGYALIHDALEVMRLQTNELGMAKVISEITGIDELSLDAVVEYALILRDGVELNFEAQVTEAYLDEVRCEIFCRARKKCKLILNDIYSVFLKRFQAYFSTPETFYATLNDLMTYVVEQELDGDIIADTLFLICFGTGMLGSSFFGDAGTKTLETLVALASDEPDNDCAIECVDCEECDVPFGVAIGSGSGPYFPASTTHGGVLCDPSTQRYQRVLLFEFDTPVMTAEIDFEWIGAHDAVIAKFENGSECVPNSADQSGMLVVQSDTPSTFLFVVTGYSEDANAYNDRAATVTAIRACT